MYLFSECPLLELLDLINLTEMQQILSYLYVLFLLIYIIKLVLFYIIFLFLFFTSFEKLISYINCFIITVKIPYKMLLIIDSCINISLEIYFVAANKFYIIIIFPFKVAYWHIGPVFSFFFLLCYTLHLIVPYEFKRILIYPQYVQVLQS